MKRKVTSDQTAKQNHKIIKKDQEDKLKDNREVNNNNPKDSKENVITVNR